MKLRDYLEEGFGIFPDVWTVKTNKRDIIIMASSEKHAIIIISRLFVFTVQTSGKIPNPSSR